VPGSSLSFRLPVLVAWLSSGLRGPGAVGRDRLKRGLLSSKSRCPPAPSSTTGQRAREEYVG
jgi:hypothetical protein